MADPYRAFLAVPGEAPPGIPLAVKDLIDTAGLVTTYGSAIYRDHVPERTASSVARLEEAGYGVVGKTNLHEFAYGITSDNPHFGTVVNPLDRERIPGRLERRQRRGPRRRALRRRRSGRTAPGRSACRRPAAVSSA